MLLIRYDLAFFQLCLIVPGINIRISPSLLKLRLNIQKNLSSEVILYN